MFRGKFKAVTCRLKRCDCWWHFQATVCVPWVSRECQQGKRSPWQPWSFLQYTLVILRGLEFHLTGISYQGVYNRHSLRKSQTCFSHDLNHSIDHLSAGIMGHFSQYLLHTYTVILLISDLTTHLLITEQFRFRTIPSGIFVLIIVTALTVHPMGFQTHSSALPSLVICLLLR